MKYFEKISEDVDVSKGLANIEKQKAEMAAQNTPPTLLERYGEPETKHKPSDEEIKGVANFAMGSTGGPKSIVRSLGKSLYNVWKDKPNEASGL